TRFSRDWSSDVCSSDLLGGVPSTAGKVTGGGQIPGEDPIFSPLGDLISIPALIPSLSNPNSKATFGFTVKCCPASGNLEYNDQRSEERRVGKECRRRVW